MEDIFDALEDKASIWREMAKHDIGLTGPALRLRYTPNLGF